MYCSHSHGKYKSFFDFAENILFDVEDERRIDYKKLEVDSPAYDVIYEKRVRRKCLNIIYTLDEVRQEMGHAGSKCIDLLIQIEKVVRQGKMYKITVDDVSLQHLILKLTDCILAECDFIAARLSAREYKILQRKLFHLSPVNSREDFLQQLRKFALDLRQDMAQETILS